MRRLYLQIYVAFLAILLVFAILVGSAWHWRGGETPEEATLDGAAVLLADRLPTGADPAHQQEALQRLAATLHVSLTLWSANGQAIASAGERLPFPGVRAQSGFMAARGGVVSVLRLPDGRWLVARTRLRRLVHTGLVAILAFLAVAVAIGAYPVVRRLTRRLERLRAGVETLGQGDLRARVQVEGRDEIAELATSFNRAADRIEAVVGAQRTLLASASHELRSPLARIRVALELMSAVRPDLRDRVARDVAELDDLIGELLLASRLQAAVQEGASEDVDLLGLLAEEAARTPAEVSGESAIVRGDARLLRRLVRNLLENAARHGAPPIEASVSRVEGRARLRVSDRGAGVPEAERERIFAPFYRPTSRSAPDGGSGLGLSLVREIARRHGGEARCLPRDGGGSCFEIDLPLAGPAPAIPVI
ncbi:MAG TPA: HAMP domain-containing sensor histidine kinase [Vicinamibacteria bacterium]|nr:HAMP domain-containing sensor histidine kinase [Vicinamibacteria bacterium]